jgi:hypothetical protein
MHFRKDHFLCEDEACLAKKFIVFQSDTEIKACLDQAVILVALVCITTIFPITLYATGLLVFILTY